MDFIQPVSAVLFPSQTQAHLRIYFSPCKAQVFFEVCDQKDCHCDFGWIPLDCKLEEFEGSADSGASPPLQSQRNLVGPLCT